MGLHGAVSRVSSEGRKTLWGLIGWTRGGKPEAREAAGAESPGNTQKGHLSSPSFPGGCIVTPKSPLVYLPQLSQHSPL